MVSQGPLKPFIHLALDLVDQNFAYSTSRILIRPRSPEVSWVNNNGIETAESRWVGKERQQQKCAIYCANLNANLNTQLLMYIFFLIDYTNTNTCIR